MLNKEESEKSLWEQVKKAVDEDRQLRSFNIDDLKSWSTKMQERALCRLAKGIGDKAHRRFLQTLEDSLIYSKGYYLESEDENS